MWLSRYVCLCIQKKAIGGPLKIFLWQENATPGPHCMYHANIWPSMTSSLTIKREISNFYGPRLYSPKQIKWTKTQLTFLVWNYYSIVLVSRHRGLSLSFSCRHSWQVLHLDQRYYMYAYVSLEMFIIDSVEWLMVRYYGEGAPSGMDQTGVQIKTWQVLLFKLFFYHAASKTSQWHRRPQLWLWQVGIILGILDRFCIWISATI